ncbi:hypothetical protein ODJ79_41825 [Actinoplanes sp. KI2]|uniref:DUF6629 family protein n=1 Tax=Actinoplanes sp. KI2 TaxID=2983315 RepID=UPI0021D6028E|nr:DUF6629 family protein [Actinoplanes sp. KI2]MCU7730297.1 hypothetical protein [Actinoplanes sp. KI2]
MPNLNRCGYPVWRPDAGVGGRMCFSASADFVAAGSVATLAAATLLRVRRRGELLFGLLPALFAVHQFVEGFVWLRVDGQLGEAAGDAAAYAYVLYAEGVLPALVPISILLIEPPSRRWRLVPFVVLGCLTAVYLFWADCAHAVTFHQDHHCIAYQTDGRFLGVAAVAYVAATCGAALISGYPWMMIFGVANLAGMAVTLIVRASAFVSLWCVYAAVTSLFVLLVFVRQRRIRSPAGRGDQHETPSSARARRTRSCPV